MITPEERKELIEIAKRLQLELRAHTERVNLVINKLIGEYDATKLAALDEAARADVPVVKQVKFNAEAPSLAVASEGPAPVLAPGKRACSNCRKPGHRAKNCPEPDRKALREAEKKGLKTGRKK